MVIGAGTAPLKAHQGALPSSGTCGTNAQGLGCLGRFRQRGSAWPLHAPAGGPGPAPRCPQSQALRETRRVGGRGRGNGVCHMLTRARHVVTTQMGWDGTGMSRPALPRDSGTLARSLAGSLRGPALCACTVGGLEPRTTGAAPRGACRHGGPRPPPSATPSQQAPGPHFSDGDPSAETHFSTITMERDLSYRRPDGRASIPGRDFAPLLLVGGAGTNF